MNSFDLFTETVAKTNLNIASAMVIPSDLWELYREKFDNKYLIDPTQRILGAMHLIEFKEEQGMVLEIMGVRYAPKAIDMLFSDFDHRTLSVFKLSDYLKQG